MTAMTAMTATPEPNNSSPFDSGPRALSPHFYMTTPPPAIHPDPYSSYPFDSSPSTSPTPEGGRVYIPRSPTPDHFFTTTPSPPPPSDDEEDDTHAGGSVMGKAPPPCPRQSSSEKRYKKMERIRDEVIPEHWALAWMFLGIEARKSPVYKLMATGFNLKPSLEEVLHMCEEIATEYNMVMSFARKRGGQSNICWVNFMRDMMEIPNLAMIKMRKVLAECKCCEKHMSRRPCAQEKKRQPGYDVEDCIYSEDGCNCQCRHLMRRFEEALLGEHPLKVNGQLWERST